MYGFLTNTLVKIVVMIEGGDGSGGLRDSDVKLVPFRNTRALECVGYVLCLLMSCIDVFCVWFMRCWGVGVGLMVGHEEGA